MTLIYKKARPVFLLAAALIFVFIVFYIIKTAVAFIQLSSKQKGMVHSIPTDYMAVFKINNQNLIGNTYTDLNTVRYPLSHFDFYEDKYFILITKLDLNNDAPLTELLSTSNASTEISMDTQYFGTVHPEISFDYLATAVRPSSIHLYLNGDSIRTIEKNDTIASYFLKMESLSVQYKKNGSYDLVSKAKGNNSPVSILFLKRKRTLYFILMTVNYKDKLKPDLLYNLVIGGDQTVN